MGACQGFLPSKILTARQMWSNIALKFTECCIGSKATDCKDASACPLKGKRSSKSFPLQMLFIYATYLLTSFSISLSSFLPSSPTEMYSFLAHMFVAHVCWWSIGWNLRWLILACCNSTSWLFIWLLLPFPDPLSFGVDVRLCCQ